MPVDGGRLGQLVDKAHTQTLALPAAQFQAGGLTTITPGRRHMPGNQLDIHRCGNQLVFVGCHVLRPRQPIAHAPPAQTDHPEPGQTAKYLPA